MAAHNVTCQFEEWRPQQQNSGYKRKQLSLISFDKMKYLTTSVDFDDPTNGSENVREHWRALQELSRTVEAEPLKKRGPERVTNGSLILISSDWLPD
jgi:hypothetical protein